MDPRHSRSRVRVVLARDLNQLNETHSTRSNRSVYRQALTNITNRLSHSLLEQTLKFFLENSTDQNSRAILSMSCGWWLSTPRAWPQRVRLSETDCNYVFQYLYSRRFAEVGVHIPLKWKRRQRLPV